MEKNLEYYQFNVGDELLIIDNFANKPGFRRYAKVVSIDDDIGIRVEFLDKRSGFGFIKEEDFDEVIEGII